MSYCYVCPYCGTHLAPGEFCDCAIANYNRLTLENKRKVDSLAFALIDAQSKWCNLHTTRKGGINVNENELAEGERKFLNLFHKTDTTKKIVTTAIMFSGSGEGGLDMVEGCARSDFKRAIKRLRELQNQYPDYATKYEVAIEHIRREWLHREEPARNAEGANHENQT